MVPSSSDIGLGFTFHRHQLAVASQKPPTQEFSWGRLQRLLVPGSEMGGGGVERRSSAAVRDLLCVRSNRAAPALRAAATFAWTKRWCMGGYGHSSAPARASQPPSPAQNRVLDSARLPLRWPQLSRNMDQNGGTPTPLDPHHAGGKVREKDWQVLEIGTSEARFCSLRFGYVLRLFRVVHSI